MIFTDSRRPAALFLAGIMIAGAAFFLMRCGGARPVLHIYAWADYFKPSLVARFEKEERCRVVIDTFDSNEAMYAKLKAWRAEVKAVMPTPNPDYRASQDPQTNKKNPRRKTK